MLADCSIDTNPDSDYFRLEEIESNPNSISGSGLDRITLDYFCEGPDIFLSGNEHARFSPVHTYTRAPSGHVSGSPDYPFFAGQGNRPWKKSLTAWRKKI